ncbi:hypothetical protein QG516_03465 [Pedobacter gandavensis]|uniref:hypothetical protein n=1 Tax=Pedobacter gandavensis TaxID=2679963 RepID=UPI0024783CF0|nr:hypothetical protein [Pedobacter gandavensis]WGQ10713.1 hypothetical protein QG516_03465 [Pedobacter gandavensis]
MPEDINLRVISALLEVKGAIAMPYTRDTILYAMEEILNTDLPDGEVNERVDQQFTLNVFYYLLCINGIYFKAEDLQDNFSMEEFNAAMLPVNNVPDYNSFTCCIKGVRLIKYLMEDPIYVTLLREYIDNEYGCTVEQYLGFYLRWGQIQGNNVDVPEHDSEFSILSKLSQRVDGVKEIQRLTALKISPVYKTKKNEFVILDKSFFVGKIYYQFIYEFWFSCVKIKSKISAKVYFSKIGLFFETYCSDLLLKLFSYLKHPVPLSLNELKYDSGTGVKELIDFYARENRNVFFAEFKLGNLNDNDRYSGNVDGLYSKGQETFFKNLEQLSSAIGNMEILQGNFDQKLELGKRLTVYPVCILNDTIYEFPTMKQTFWKKWEDIRKKYPELEVKPLVILQIEELEDLVYHLAPNGEAKKAWKILNEHCKIKNKRRKFSLSGLDAFPLDYQTDMDEELQGYMDAYIN